MQLDSIKREKEYTNLFYQFICGDYHRILNIYIHLNIFWRMIINLRADCCCDSGGLPDTRLFKCPPQHPENGENINDIKTNKKKKLTERR